MASSSQPSFSMYDSAHPSSLHIEDNGIGVGTIYPDAPLHVYGDGTFGSVSPFVDPWIFVENADQTTADRNMIVLSNNGGSNMMFDNTSNNMVWRIGQTNAGAFRISQDGSFGPEFRIMANGRIIAGPAGNNRFDLRPNGNLIIAGALVQSSDRNKKENFEDFDAQAVLEKLAEIPITRWNYKADDEGVRHIGPMAQDFYQQFQVGMDDKTISPIDTAGVNMLAIQALYANGLTRDDSIVELEKAVEFKDVQIGELRAQVEQLQSTLDSIQFEFQSRIESLEAALNR